MAELWHNYWQLIIPGTFLIIALVCGILDGDKAVRVYKYPKIRTWLMFGTVVALFLLWHSVGMYFWEMGLRPVLFVLTIACGVLFVWYALRCRKYAQGRALTWLTYLFLNLIPGWFIGIFCAGIFQTLHRAGPEGVSQALVKIGSQVLLYGAVGFVLWGFLFGGDGRIDVSKDRSARQDILQDKIKEVNDLIGYRNDRARSGADVSDLDCQINRMKQEIHDMKRNIK